MRAGPITLLKDETATTTGESKNVWKGLKSFQVVMTGSGTVSATVDIDVSTDGSTWLTLGTISVSGTDSAADGFVSEESWPHHRADLTAISGTSGSVSVYVGA